MVTMVDQRMLRLYVDYVIYTCIYIYILGPLNLHFRSFLMVNNLFLSWPNPVFFMVLRAHGIL